jgi:hypothetical protein
LKNGGVSVQNRHLFVDGNFDMPKHREIFRFVAASSEWHQTFGLIIRKQRKFHRITVTSMVIRRNFDSQFAAGQQN